MLPRQEEPLFDGNEEEQEENVFVNQFAPMDEHNQHGVNQWGVNHHREIIEVPRVDNRRWEFGFKLDLPEFTGGLQPEEFLDWINTTEELLEFKKVPIRAMYLLWQQFRGTIEGILS